MILVNISNQDFIINDGDRVEQMVIAKHEQTEWVGVEQLIETDRGAGAFGYTGTK